MLREDYRPRRGGVPRLPCGSCEPAGSVCGDPLYKKRRVLQQSEMSSPPLRGTAEWSATREVALLLGLTGGNRYAAQQLWLRKERIKAEASQFASAGPQQASQQPAGCRAKPGSTPTTEPRI